MNARISVARAHLHESEARLRKRLVYAATVFISLSVFFAFIRLGHFAVPAPEEMHRFMQISGYISAVLAAAGTLATYALASGVAWSLAVLAEAELSQTALVRAGGYFIGMACLCEIADFVLADAYLFPLLDESAFASPEAFMAFLEEDIRESEWQVWRSRLDIAFLAASPVVFGIGLARSEEEAAWAKGVLEGVLGGVSVAVVLAVVVVAGAALQ